MSASSTSRASPADPAVTAFLDQLDHPLRADFIAIRQLVLAADPTIQDGIKWKAPSFRTSDWFATVNLRSTDTAQLIFHLGAKVKKLPPGGLQLADPAGLVHWLAKDRCTVTLGRGPAIAQHATAFTALVRAWLAYL